MTIISSQCHAVTCDDDDVSDQGPGGWARPEDQPGRPPAPAVPPGWAPQQPPAYAPPPYAGAPGWGPAPGGFVPPPPPKPGIVPLRPLGLGLPGL